MEKADDVKLGDLARDTVSNFEGIIIGITEWLWGCVTIGLHSQELHEGKPIETQWFDKERLIKIKDKNQVISKITGGPDRKHPIK